MLRTAADTCRWSQFEVASSDMASTPIHRKRVKHFRDSGHCHELTFSTYCRQPLLTNNLWRTMLCQSIDLAAKRHRYRTIAFVLMPEHVHLLTYPEAEAAGIDELLKAIKRPFSFRIKQLLIQSKSQLLDKLTIRQRPDVTTFRFWQEGPGYDRNLTHAKSVLQAIDYLHNNPVRRGLVRRAVDWRWSSARHYLLPDPAVDPDLPNIHKLPA
jgi:REP-associated tyrosine transposase